MTIELNKIHQGDCFELFKNLDNESIDLVVTDPPYKTISGGRKKNDGQPSGILLSNDGKIFKHNDVKIKDWLSEVYRVLKPNTHCYVMTNVLNMQEMINESINIGFKLHNILIWKKNNVTPSQYYMKNAEYILFLRKGRAKYINNIGTKTVLDVNNVKNRIHPTQKPVELIEILVANSSNKGDIVLDPFIGSGTTAVACVNLDRNYIGFELDSEFHNKANERVELSILERNKNK